MAFSREIEQTILKSVWKHKRPQTKLPKKELEKEMAIHSSVLAWKTPRMEKPGGLQSMESQRVGHD